MKTGESDVIELKLTPEEASAVCVCMTKIEQIVPDSSLSSRIKSVIGKIIDAVNEADRRYFEATGL